jgi:hypothetical protein
MWYVVRCDMCYVLSIVHCPHTHTTHNRQYEYEARSQEPDKIAFEQFKPDYLLWAPLRSGFASSSTPTGYWLLIATKAWPG